MSIELTRRPVASEPRPAAMPAGVKVSAVLLGLAWLVGGLLGLFHPLDAYAAYRGFPAPRAPLGVAVGTGHPGR